LKVLLNSNIKMAYRFISLLAALNNLVYCQKLSCPSLLCSDAALRPELDPDLCLERDEEQPAQYFTAYSCDYYKNKQ
jgi:hypothetical protein